LYKITLIFYGGPAQRQNGIKKSISQAAAPSRRPLQLAVVWFFYKRLIHHNGQFRSHRCRGVGII
jgi:hypothetical protein